MDQTPGAKLTYQNRVEVAETFVDFLERVWIDGSVLRLEFTVNRFDDSKGPGQFAGSRCTACRLVMPRTALLQLVERLSQLVSALEKDGVIKLPEKTTGKSN